MTKELLRESAKAVQLKLSDLDRLSFQIRAGAATLVAAVAAFGRTQDLWTVAICILIIGGFAVIDAGLKNAMYKLYAASTEIEQSINNKETDRYRDPHCELNRSSVRYDSSRFCDYFLFYVVLSVIPIVIGVKLIASLA